MALRRSEKISCITREIAREDLNGRARKSDSPLDSEVGAQTVGFRPERLAALSGEHRTMSNLQSYLPWWIGEIKGASEEDVWSGPYEIKSIFKED